MGTSIRILIAGDYRYPWYEKACADALEHLGHEVIRFSWRGYFATVPGRIEEHLAWSGPVTWQVNRALARAGAENEIDVLLVWRGVHVTSDTLRLIRRQNPRSILVSYNNDDPFGPIYASRSASIHQRRLWVRFRQSIPEYDLNLVARPINVLEYRAAGARDVRVFMQYFVPQLHRPRELTPDERQRYECDVVFVGHYEADGREQYLSALARAGLKVRVFGTGWPNVVLTRIFHELPIVCPVYGDDYSKALCGAKLCLCFLSRLNRDSYTRRTFEIPACGRLMLSERTTDLTRLFAEDREAVYFGSEAELVEKAIFYVNDDVRRESMAKAGLDRAWRSGHDVVSRMVEITKILPP